MNKNPIQRVHIFSRKVNDMISQKAQELHDFFNQHLVSCSIINTNHIPDEKPDMVFVLGGDGTFLSASHRYAAKGIPILGIDMGGLGFLTEVSVEVLFDAAKAVLEGDYTVEDRMMVDCSIHHTQRGTEQDIALNDVVIYRGPFAQMIHLSTFIDDEYLATFPADGLIIGTPTGSTAYSLSAGGPVIHPTLDLFIITPICAHTLYARSIIVQPTSSIRLILESTKEGTMVTLDGQRGFGLDKGDYIEVRKSKLTNHMVKLVPEKPFYSLLRDKLSWGMDIRKRID
ncbi:NAD(+)/NADH kinase [Atribacter laminatus]|uniref:NAD kinase n=1 Tax=Atribacter laminatus TaxID=2847778 RepID=A0A7T1ANS6_ATRLM|nr:NAD(+)/NADH kinase [Atribacter laminatus]QPM69313.1 NAD kinase [Atribacter laminatus]